MFKYNYTVDLESDTSAAQILRLIRHDSKVLEVGCATGYMSQILKEKMGCSIIGIEIDEIAANEAQKYCDKIILGNIEHIDFDEYFLDQEFDYIIFADVLEHLLDPETILKKCQRVLKNEGAILSSIPNISHSAISLNLLRGNFNYNRIGLLDETHVKLYTKKSIYTLFEKSGFNITYLNRTIIFPEFTEFNIDRSTFPKEVIDYIYNNNEEAETYQFIIQAVKINEINKIKELYQQLEQKDIEKKELEKELLTRKQSLELQIKYSASLEEIISNKDKEFINLENHILDKEKKNNEELLAESEKLISNINELREENKGIKIERDRLQNIIIELEIASEQILKENSKIHSDFADIQNRFMEMQETCEKLKNELIEESTRNLPIIRKIQDFFRREK